MWIAHTELPTPPGHPFYQRLNAILDEYEFDRFVEERCSKFYAARMGRPSVAPGIYFRLLLVGYFEGLDSERGIAWRTADSLALREFLGLKLSENPADHSTISRTRRLIDVETHEGVFTWVLSRLGEAGLVQGKTIGVDATTLEANAALRSIVRRDTQESYEEFLTGLAKASGIETPTREELTRLDRRRAKKGSNRDWTHPHDPDARITKMKDGRTHLAHKAEHAVDLETGAIVAVTVQGADQGDTSTVKKTLITVAEQLETVLPEEDTWEEVVGDKGYHSTEGILDLERLGIRSYISEPRRGRRRWRGDREGGDWEAQTRNEEGSDAESSETTRDTGCSPQPPPSFWRVTGGVTPSAVLLLLDDALAWRRGAWHPSPGKRNRAGRSHGENGLGLRSRPVGQLRL